MIEKGSRKTAPPDTARVKVHRYILQMNTRHKNIHSQYDTTSLLEIGIYYKIIVITVINNSVVEVRIN